MEPEVCPPSSGCREKNHDDVMSFHEAVKLGNLEKIREFVKGGVSVDIQDEEGKTALHHAAELNLYDVIVYLVFLGADPHKMQKDGLGPTDGCKIPEMRDALRKTKKLTSNENIRELDYEKISMTSSRRRKFRKNCVKAKLVNLPPESGVQMQCRRIKQEGSLADFHLHSEEHICSDVFILATNTFGALEVELDVPLFDYPEILSDNKLESNEEIVIRTSNGDVIESVKIKDRKNTRYCHFKTELSFVTSYVCVSRPRVELINAGPQPLSFVSKVDPKFSLTFPANIFKDSFDLKLKIKDKPGNALPYSNILAATNFYLLESNKNNKSDNPLTVTVHIPDTNMPEMTLLVAYKDTLDAGIDDSTWKFIDGESEESGDKVRCLIPLFKVLVCIALKKIKHINITNQESDVEDIKQSLDELFQSQIREMFDVVFYISFKEESIDQVQTTTILITCCRDSKSNQILHAIAKDGFRTCYCTNISKVVNLQMFSVTLDKALASYTDNISKVLQFIPRRHNYIVFTVKCKLDIKIHLRETDIRQVYKHKGQYLGDVCVEVPLSVYDYSDQLFEKYEIKDQTDSFTDAKRLSENSKSLEFRNSSQVIQVECKDYGSTKIENLSAKENTKDCSVEVPQSKRNLIRHNSFANGDMNYSEQGFEGRKIQQNKQAKVRRSKSMKDSSQTKSEELKELEFRQLVKVSEIKDINVTVDRNLKENEIDDRDKVYRGKQIPAITVEIGTEICSANSGGSINHDDNDSDDDVEFNKTNEIILDSREFLSDAHVARIIDEVNDSWCNVLVSVGVPFETIYLEVKQAEDEQEIRRVCEKLLCKWRDDHTDRVDKGVPILLSGLRKGRAFCVSVSVQNRLAKWCERHGDHDPLSQWFKQALANLDIYIPSGYPRPLSDPFFMLLAPDIYPPEPLSHALLNTDIAPITADARDFVAKCRTVMTMRIMTMFRDTNPEMAEISVLEKLLTTLDGLKLDVAKTTAFASIRGWIGRCKTDDLLKSSAQSLLTRLDPENEAPVPVKKPASADAFRGHRTRLSVASARNIFRSKPSN